MRITPGMVNLLGGVHAICLFAVRRGDRPIRTIYTYYVSHRVYHIMSVARTSNTYTPRTKRQDFELMGKTTGTRKKNTNKSGTLKIQKKSAELKAAAKLAAEQEARRRRKAAGRYQREHEASLQEWERKIAELKAAAKLAAEQEARRQREAKRTPQPLFTPEQRYEIHENWRKRNQEAHEPGFFERATHELFEYFDPTPKYRPNAGPHMMSVATDANDIVTLRKYWGNIPDEDSQSKKVGFAMLWLRRYVVYTLYNKGVRMIDGKLVNIPRDKAYEDEEITRVFNLISVQKTIDDLRKEAYSPPPLPTGGPSAPQIARYIEQMDVQTIFDMVAKNTWRTGVVVRY